MVGVVKYLQDVMYEKVKFFVVYFIVVDESIGKNNIIQLVVFIYDVKRNFDVIKGRMVTIRIISGNDFLCIIGKYLCWINLKLVVRL